MNKSRNNNFRNTGLEKGPSLFVYLFLFLSSYANAQTSSYHVNVDSLITKLTTQNVTNYTWNIKLPNDWSDLSTFLPNAKIASISVTVSLLPPSQTPPINPAGSYSEPYKLDFITWGKEIAKLSLRYSNLTGFAIDSMRENLKLKYIRQTYLDSVIAAGQSINRKLQFETMIPAPKTYYISNSGNDNYSGLSPDSAWATPHKVTHSTFSPGDRILFKKGDSWIGGNDYYGRYYPILGVSSSGTSQSPIYFGSYGSGNKPYFRSATTFPIGQSPAGMAIVGSYITVDGFKMDSCYFVAFAADGINITIKNCEVAHSAGGLFIRSTSGTSYNTYDLFTLNYVHDGIECDNNVDTTYGALGVSIASSNNEISYNTFENCITVSSLYGSDGGFIDINLDGGKVDSNRIHNNIVYNSDDFLEIAGVGECVDNVFSYNVVYKNDTAPNKSDMIILANPQDYKLYNLQLINNTIYDNTLLAAAGTGIISWDVSHKLTPSELSLWNNIILTDSCQIINDGRLGGFGGSNNIFYRYDGNSDLGFTLGSLGVNEDPKLTDIDAHNFIPLFSSPAIDGGLDMGYYYDLIGTPIVNTPDIGAYELRVN